MELYLYSSKRFHGVDGDNFPPTFTVSSGDTYDIAFINPLSVLNTFGNRKYHFLQ